jgi:poly-gamma-glutamate synthesis protein (capsule biosynthesis protein)
MSSADLAMANMEGPAPDKSRYHSGGKLFTFDQDMLVGLKNAGIDIVSLANNHIGNAGRDGVRQTVAALDKVGIAHMGAGGNDVAAHTPVMRTIAGVKVAVFGYDAVAASYAAGPGLAGTAYLDTSMASDVAAARKAGAQVVIVYPHWGTEYTVGPNNAQVRWAHRMIDAGVDVVIGNHPHWAQAMEVYKGKPIWYGLGNFVFDQTWSEQTEEGLILELTFNGTTLVQAWMHPIIDLSAAQPNLLDTASAQHVLDQVYKASKKYLPW